MKNIISEEICEKPDESRAQYKQITKKKNVAEQKRKIMEKES